MKNYGGYLVLLAVIAAVVLTVLVIVQTYGIYADVDSMLDRVQVSADATKMTVRLDKLLQNMDRYGINEGHAAIIFRNPQNNVGFDREAIQDLRDRAREISEFPTSSVEYQVGLNDMRGTLREIEIEAWYYALIRNPLFWITLLIWVTLIIWVGVDLLRST